MSFISSREYGRQPFAPAKGRGHWAAGGDYMYASVAMAFKVDFSTVKWFMLFRQGISGFVFYVLNVCILVMPSALVQAFLGQFSGSGFISSLRLSPIFKAVGYTSLAFNFFVLTYYSVFASTPLFYFLHSWRPTLPWSCEGVAQWMWKITDRHLCNETAIENLKKMSKFENHTRASVRLPSAMFFDHQFGVDDMFNDYDHRGSDVSLNTAWQPLLCSFLVWAAVAYVFYKCRQVETFGKVLRALTLATLSLLAVCFVRFMFLLNTSLEEIAARFFYLNWKFIRSNFFLNGPNTLQVFGPGCGAAITLASFNRCRNDFARQILVICASQMAIVIAFISIIDLLEGHVRDGLEDENGQTFAEDVWTLFLGSGSAIAKLELPNLWSVLYFGMLTLCSFIVILIQVFSFFTTLFDEFACLRDYKSPVMFGLIGIWSVLSWYTCTVEGHIFSLGMALDSMVVELTFQWLVFIMVLWVYGWQRFQRDLEFMLGYSFATWKIQFIRFVTTAIFLYILLVVAISSLSFHFKLYSVMSTLSLIFIFAPCICVPLSFVFLMRQATGSFGQRWRKVCLPTDWYPTDRADRHRYEERRQAAEASAATQPLEEFTDISLHSDGNQL